MRFITDRFQSLGSRRGGPAGLRRLAGDRRGVTAIEFGFIVTPLMALMIGVLQVSTTYFTQQALESVAEKGARLLMTGGAQKAGLNAASFKTALCGALPTYLKCENLLVDVSVATDFNSAVVTSPTITYDSAGNPNNTMSYTTGNPGDILVMRTMYVWNVQKAPLGFDISTMTANRRLLVATSVFRAENY